MLRGPAAVSKPNSSSLHHLSDAMNRPTPSDQPVPAPLDPDLGLDMVAAPPEQRRVRWGDVIAIPEPGTGAEPRIEARVRMYPDKSRFFVSYPSGKEEVLSAAQFVALVLELKRSHRFTFDRKRG
jgi:hypothetical protein